jgi:hypothetical protein
MSNNFKVRKRVICDVRNEFSPKAVKTENNIYIFSSCRRRLAKVISKVIGSQGDQMSV